MISLFNSSENKRTQHEAYYYEKLSDQNVQCLLCPHNCMIKPGKAGICHNKVNTGGKLFCIDYGNPCALNVDPIEKKPLYHFKPQSKVYSIATTGCNFHCLNCQNYSISQGNHAQAGKEILMPEEVVAHCLKENCMTIAYTYSEPITFYEYMFDIAQLANEKGISNVLISNGYINEKPLLDLSKYLSAANINLKSFDETLHQKLTGGKLFPVLNTLKTLKDKGVWLEITNLIVPTWSDDMDMIKRMCDWLIENGFKNTPLHFSRFSPTYKLSTLPYTPLSTLESARNIALNAGIRFVYIGNVAHHEAENSFCPSCHKTLVERNGYHIISNHIKEGKCAFCDARIEGVW
ncbi:MAG: AmmeMemoRadiSam system radical SAM enzyme [Bacteroidota bacterium]